MYETALLHGSLALDRFIADTINPNNYEIIGLTQNGLTYTLVYKTK